MRRWLAWKLRQLSIRLNDCRYHEQVLVNVAGAAVLDLRVEADDYGAGIFHFDTPPHPGPVDISISRHRLDNSPGKPPD